MRPQLEHVNVTVSDLDATAAFLCTALDGWEVRGRGEGEDRLWMHVGTDATYIALEQVKEPAQAEGSVREPYVERGVNHLGFVVASVDEVRARCSEAGYREGFQAADHPARRRAYFHDLEDNEYEFVEYLSDDAHVRNGYGD